MKRKGLAKFGQNLINICNGHLKGYNYKPRTIEPESVKDRGPWLIKNVNIVDVDRGVIFPEKAIIINNKRFGSRIASNELERVESISSYVLDGSKRFLIPGLSDIHCHLTLISEHGMKLNDFFYFDAQRYRSAEYALEKGCTTVRDSLGAYELLISIDEKIKRRELLGPRILPSYIALTPPGGMWDINPLTNKFAEMMFGGRVACYPKTLKEIDAHLDLMIELGAHSFKLYLEERPLFGSTRDKLFNMFSDNELCHIRKRAEEHGKIMETHSMFINGARRAINAGVHSIAHLTVDTPYSLEDAEKMCKSNTAIVPTFGVGSFLAMDCGYKGYPENKEYLYYREMLNRYTLKDIDSGTVPELNSGYLNAVNFIKERIVNRKIPMVGTVYPERCHGFALNAAESMSNFKKAGTRIGVGTDGGTGVSFPGALDLEFDLMKRYNFSNSEILRAATLGNMEIVKMDSELGSIEEGKLADMLLVDENPFNNIFTVTSPLMVFKEGDCLINNLNKERE